MRNLHGWCAVLPLGVFLVLHLLLNARVLLGPSWDSEFSAFASPALFWVEALLVWVPLALHTAYASWLALAASTEASGKPRAATLLTRASGFAALSFVVYHALEFRIPHASGALNAADIPQKLYAELSATTQSGMPLTAALYLLGLAATVFHAGHGAYWMYARSHAGADATRAARWVGSCATLLFVLGAQTVVYCATGSRFFFW
ncbi:MAG TPA: hypothetical protein VK524_22715 [Polyangiaceae bacterium]|nr:hypothetical protein [Polyangiaceae bacterium]